MWASQSPYGSILYELERLPGLNEVVFGINQSPAPFIEALASRFSIAVGVMACQDANGHLDTWTAVEDLARRFPLEGRPEVVVIVVDPSVLANFHTAFADDNFDLGPIMQSGALRGLQDPTSGLWVGMAGVMADLMEQLRKAVEDEGGRVVVISQDARPARGRGPWEKSHAYRDTRLRSTLGDAGRHYAHQRYLVSTTRKGDVISITAWKDEHEGRTGRLLEEALWSRRAQQARKPNPCVWLDREVENQGNSTDNSPMSDQELGFA